VVGLHRQPRAGRADAGLLQVAYLRSPTTGGVFASFASLADVAKANNVDPQKVIDAVDAAGPLGLDVALPPGSTLGTTFSPAAMPQTGAAGSARSYSFAQGLAATRVVGLNGVGGVLPKGAAALRKAAGK